MVTSWPSMPLRRELPGGFATTLDLPLSLTLLLTPAAAPDAVAVSAADPVTP